MRLKSFSSNTSVTSFKLYLDFATIRGLSIVFNTQFEMSYVVLAEPGPTPGHGPCVTVDFKGDSWGCQLSHQSIVVKGL